MDIEAARQRPFRWRFYDAALGDQWSGWHSGDAPCAACCCKTIPNDGEHREPAEYYDEDGILTTGHSWFDPELVSEVEYL